MRSGSDHRWRWVLRLLLDYIPVEFPFEFQACIFKQVCIRCFGSESYHEKDIRENMWIKDWNAKVREPSTCPPAWIHVSLCTLRLGGASWQCSGRGIGFHALLTLNHLACICSIQSTIFLQWSRPCLKTNISNAQPSSFCPMHHFCTW